MAALEKEVNNVKGKQKAAIDKAKQEVKEQSKKVNQAVKKFEDAANAPGTFVGKACDEAKGFFSALAGGFNTFGDYIYGKRKRSSCKIPNLVDIPRMKEPDLDLSETLKPILKMLRPDINLLDFD